MPAFAVQNAKKLLRSAWSRRLADITAEEQAAFAEAAATPAAKEACSAFLEGRMPNFKK